MLLLYVSIENLIDGDILERPLAWIATLVMSLISGFAGLDVLLTTIEVRRSSVRFLSPFKRTEVQFKDVVEIKLIPLYGGFDFMGFNVVLMERSRRGTGVSASYYANRHELLKAIIDGVYQLNPDVAIDRYILDAYGKPPYSSL